MNNEYICPNYEIIKEISDLPICTLSTYPYDVADYCQGNICRCCKARTLNEMLYDLSNEARQIAIEELATLRYEPHFNTKDFRQNLTEKLTSKLEDIVDNDKFIYKYIITEENNSPDIIFNNDLVISFECHIRGDYNVFYWTISYNDVFNDTDRTIKKK